MPTAFAMLAQVLGPVDPTAFQGACLTLLEMRNFLIGIGGIGCIYFIYISFFQDMESFFNEKKGTSTSL